MKKLIFALGLSFSATVLAAPPPYPFSVQVIKTILDDPGVANLLQGQFVKSVSQNQNDTMTYQVATQGCFLDVYLAYHSDPTVPPGSTEFEVIPGELICIK